MTKLSAEDLSLAARRVRAYALRMVSAGGSSHIGSALSCIDILVVLYGRILNCSPETVSAPSRDKFILSKGHAGAAVYATLAEFGFIDGKLLSTHCQNGSLLSGHVSHHGLPGIELSTGSLGHGLPVGVGMALASQLDNSGARVFVLLGDGEIMEGANWEAIMLASHLKLKNLTIIVDRNYLQSIDTTEKTVALDPLDRKLAAFNWNVHTVDGHDYGELERVLSFEHPDHPTVVIANTIKGKGVDFMEGKVEWHYKFPNPEQLSMALIGLGAVDED